MSKRAAVVCLVLVFLAVLTPPGSAGVWDTRRSVPPSAPEGFGDPPDGSDESCDDEAVDEGQDLVLGCEVSKVLVDLDGAIPAATFFGSFCDLPEVTVGNTDGTYSPLVLLSAATGFVTADISGRTEAATYLFRVGCPCAECEIGATIGTMGPTGPSGLPGPEGAQGPTGPNDPDQQEIKITLCQVSAALGIGIPSFCTATDRELQVVSVDNPPVAGSDPRPTGTCSVSGAVCLDNRDCDPLDPNDLCIGVPPSGSCVIHEWSALLGNVSESGSSGDSRFEDITVEDLTIHYSWSSGFVMSPLHLPLGGVIPPEGTRSIEFFPITAEDLASLTATFPSQARSAILTLTFEGRVETGDLVDVSIGSQLLVEACD